jgi:cell wall-associated NlpC family hydrolase
MFSNHKISLSGYFLTGFFSILLLGLNLSTAQAATHKTHKAKVTHVASKHKAMPKEKVAHVSKKHLEAKPLKTKVASRKKAASLKKVAWNVKQQQGKMYRFGGSSPATGFDCSGLTQYTYKRTAGVQIPRTAAAQYRIASKVSRNTARKGDLVFFQTRGRRIGHVGIYLGSGQFIHSPRPGKPVTTSPLKGYWARHLVGFGRIPGVCVPIVP